jgi:hypothetical protein
MVSNSKQKMTQKGGLEMMSFSKLEKDIFEIVSISKVENDTKKVG